MDPAVSDDARLRAIGADGKAALRQDRIQKRRRGEHRRLDDEAALGVSLETILYPLH